MRRKRSTTTKSGTTSTSASSSTGRSTDRDGLRHRPILVRVGLSRFPRETASLLSRDHPVHAEQLLGVGPDFFGREPRPLAQFLEVGDRILAGKFGVDRKSTRLNSS